MAVKQETFRVAADMAKIVREFRQRYWRWHIKLPFGLILLPMLPFACLLSFLFYIEECALEELAAPGKRCSHRSGLVRGLVTIAKEVIHSGFVSIGWDVADESLADWLQRTHRALFSGGLVVSLVVETIASLVIWYALLLSMVQ